jgi:hypothetical protein
MIQKKIGSFLQRYIVALSLNRCCQGNVNYNFSFIVAGADVAVSNIKVLRVITEMLQCVPFALLLKIISTKFYESGSS